MFVPCFFYLKWECMLFWLLWSAEFCWYSGRVPVSCVESRILISVISCQHVVWIPDFGPLFILSQDASVFKHGVILLQQNHWCLHQCLHCLQKVSMISGIHEGRGPESNPSRYQGMGVIIKCFKSQVLYKCEQDWERHACRLAFWTMWWTGQSYVFLPRIKSQCVQQSILDWEVLRGLNRKIAALCIVRLSCRPLTTYKQNLYYCCAIG